MAEATSTILQVADVKSGTVNDILTPGRNLKISGSRLKISGDSPANGIYFIETATQERIPVDSGDIVTNNPSELIIVIPDLPAGNYTVEVTTQFSGSSVHLKESRTAFFDKQLTVE
ncbi:DUF4469 domain-containing protein [Chryseobacterium arachidis]|uniref:DUF4469 domain-containing protein n=1 Tax=Chryseobacterium arachidis TaxID=1416778 RepID=UPI003623A4CB